MQLFNKSKRTIDGAKSGHEFTVEEAHAKKLLALYPNDIIKAGDKEEVKNLEDEIIKLMEENEQLKKKLKSKK